MKAYILKGIAHKYGDNINTDVIIPARYCTSMDPDYLGLHCMEDHDSEFVKRIKKGDILVAGENFGCGSSRENAPIAIKGAGISCVIAKSFARIFYRNAVNIGLPIMESREAVDNIDSGDLIHADIKSGRITNRTKNKIFSSVPFPDFVKKIIDCGGMIQYVRNEIKIGRK
ncbi:MAG: 3-isopropylmalate dehydratase small subunit [Fidelibacterota bacterium]